MWRELLLWLPLLAVTMADPIRKRYAATDSNEQLQHLDQNFELISRQLMMQQFYVEEQARNFGNSGIKCERKDFDGTRPFYSASFSDSSNIAHIHNHPVEERMAGYSEMTMVMNGVEFKTHYHTDFKLRMRKENGPQTRDIPFPEVPPEVTQYYDVADQMVEMKKWFEAWRDQDFSVRDYRPYFKPVLCYMEGSWTHATDKAYQKDQHYAEVSGWFDTNEVMRFASYAGTRDRLEKFEFLPTTIMTMHEGKDPVLVQWRYEIMCHPIKTDLPLNRLRVVDDLQTRMAMGGVTLEEYEQSKSARFQVGMYDQDIFADGNERWSLMDRMMEEIPGHDGSGGMLTDQFYGDTAYQFNDNDEMTPLNTAFFHRWYKVSTPGASGRKTRRRGFSDDNLFVAQTTDPKVAGMQCKGTKCGNLAQKWTYAIPLEIIYMTPLSSWNPFNFVHYGDAKSASGKVVKQGPNGKRTGANSPNKALNGTNTKYSYRLPKDFFVSTTRDKKFVLNKDGVINEAVGSGIRIFIPEIPGVGTLRQRYPIMPVHEEGRGVWKELSALTDIALSPSKYRHMFREDYPLRKSKESEHK